MGPIAEGIIIGMSGISMASVLALAGGSIVKLWHTPKRLDRIEAGYPLIFEGLALLLDVTALQVRCQQGSKCNGELDNANESIRTYKKKLSDHLTLSTISKKET
jgi:hypothetical protein